MQQEDQRPYGDEMVRIQFSRRDCQAWSVKEQCRPARSQGRGSVVATGERNEVMQAAGQEQKTAAFKEKYRQRAGIEGRHAQGVSVFGLRTAR